MTTAMPQRTSMLDRALDNAQRTPLPAAITPGMARHDHPDTAIAAARQIGPQISRQHAVVLAVLADSDGGLTAAELERDARLSGSSIRPRLVELTGADRKRPQFAERPLVARTDTTRPTPSGRAAHVYQLTPLGRQVADLLARHNHQEAP